MNPYRLYRSVTLVLLLSALPALAQFTPIYTFNGNVEGCCANPPALLAQGTDGNLYGTLPSGGSWNAGSWLQYNMSGLPILTGFGTTTESGSNSGFTLGIDTYLYGGVSHTNGGSSAGGIIRMLPGGTPSLVYQFTGGTNGTFPVAPPIQGTDFNLYGVTKDYGNTGYVYQIVMNTSTGTGTLGWVHPLPSGSSAALIVGSDGNYYGTYSNGSFSTNPKGGIIPSPNGYGGIFQVTPAGAIGWYYNLNPFSTNNGGNGDGSNPIGAVMQAADGNLYGTASGGGTNATAGGLIFKIAANGTGYTVIHNFVAAEGITPHGGLVQGSNGNLYTLTTNKGTLPANLLQQGFISVGTLFTIAPTGANPTQLVPFFRMPSLGGQGTGSDPEATLALHTNGTLYGLTHIGGYNASGATTGPGGYDDAGEFFSYNPDMSPFISIVGRRSAIVGDQVNIIGRGFLNATGVTFGGVSAQWAKFKVIIWSDTYMTVTVPTGAKTGPVVVQEPYGNLSTTYNFTIPCTSIFCMTLPGHP